MVPMHEPRVFGGSFPPGCREADLERGGSSVLPQARLWRLLDDVAQARLYRRFFTEEWAELSALLEEREEEAGRALRALWLTWRAAAIERLAREGRIL